MLCLAITLIKCKSSYFFLMLKNITFKNFILFCHSIHLHYLCNQDNKDKTMRKVIGIGETVLDIIFKNGKPIEAVPGGSAFNAMISLGRSGINATFISEAGND